MCRQNPSPGIFEVGESENVIYFWKSCHLWGEFRIFSPDFSLFSAIFPRFWGGDFPKVPKDGVFVQNFWWNWPFSGVINLNFAFCRFEIRVFSAKRPT